MAVDWTISKTVRRSDVRDEHGNLRGAFKDALLATSLTGVPRITERSFDLYYKRYRMFCVVAGYPKPDKHYLRGLKGLSTNASPMTDAAFRNAMIARLERRVLDEG